MNPPRQIEIVGGGLAGLSLGLALRRAGVPVTIFEAGAYPRHRVCGEFITGLKAPTIARLGLAPLLGDAGRLREVAWLARGRVVRRQQLPAPALAMSRHTLDARLAEAFTAAGGHLLTGTRLDPNEAPEGRVFATGRRRTTTATWLGLKLHVRGLRLTSELEFHLGDGAYVGLCPVEDGRVNVCGLFRPRDEVAAGRETVLAGYLRATGLDALAARLGEAEICPASCSAVAGVGFDRRGVETDRLNLGDTFAMIPPFTGNGMAMAFQAAESALDPLLAWAGGGAGWTDTVRLAGGRLRRRFRRRLAAAAAVHPFLHSPPRQRWLALAARARLLPLGPLYHLLH
jgi:flavin-dependent dehydrogenase